MVRSFWWKLTLSFYECPSLSPVTLSWNLFDLVCSGRSHCLVFTVFIVYEFLAFYFQSTCVFIFFFPLIFLFFFFLFVVNFVIHWNEKALGSHVFPIPIPPPTSLPTHSLQVLPEHLCLYLKYVSRRQQVVGSFLPFLTISAFRL